MQQAIKVRFAEAEDLSALVDIYNQAIVDQCTAVLKPVSLEARIPWFEEHIRDKFPILLAEKGKDILGYIYLSPYRPGRSALRHTAEVSYFVEYKVHRGGVGSALMKACIEMCPRLKIKTLIAILLESNQPSLGLLKKFRFEQWAFLPDVAEIDGETLGQVYFGRRIEKEQSYRSK